MIISDPLRILASEMSQASNPSNHGLAEHQDYAPFNVEASQSVTNTLGPLYYLVASLRAVSVLYPRLQLVISTDNMRPYTFPSETYPTLET